MEVHFPRKALAAHEASSPQVVLLAVLNYHRLSQTECIGSGKFDRLSIACLPATIVRTYFDKSKVCALTAMPLQWLHKCCFDKNASWCCPWLRFVVFTTMDSLALPLNWIHSKIISEATVRIIGLTKIAKIEFLPLDWIYRIMTV